MANNISRANRIKRSPGDAFVQVLLYVFVALFAIATVIPFLYVLAGSFATEQELTEKSFFLFPTVFSTNAYSYIVKDGSIFRGLANSLLVTAVGTFISSGTFRLPLEKRYHKHGYRYDAVWRWYGTKLHLSCKYSSSS